MTDTSDHPPGDQAPASLPLPASHTGGSHLAHWPPPKRGHEVKPAHVKHHPGEPAESTKPHGLGLTRSAFSDDE